MNKELAHATGTKIRALRESQRLRLIDVAERAGLSTGYLSQIERDKVNPSVSTMRKIANALSVTIGELFDSTIQISADLNGRTVVRGHERGIASFSNQSVRFEIVNSSAGRNLVMIHMRADPGAESGEPLGHRGQECALVISGCMEFWLNGEYYVLLPSDAIYVDADVPHHWRSCGEEPLEVIWAMSPPIY